MENVEAFFNAYDVVKRPWSIISPNMQFLNRKAEVVKTWNMELQMTSWTTLYYRLRANFDGLQSKYCPELPSMTPEKREGTLADGVGKAKYDQGKTVTDVKETNGTMTVLFSSMDGGGSIEADLVIAADGPSSTIRQIVQPEVQRKYIGYVAWRGTVVEKEVSEATKGVFRERLTYYRMSGSHILLYLIPGENGSLEPGERVLNYVWYTCESEEKLDQILTNANGHRHRVTLPAGEIREEVWAKQVERAVNDLPTPFAELVQKTTQPFVQAITDVTSGPPSFFNGKLIFVGDALAAFRPHVACSTNQAALHALLFEKVMTGAMTLQEWEDQSLQYAQVTSLLSVVLGNMNQSDFWSLPASVFWFGRAWIMQWIRKRWLGVSAEAPHSLARRIPTSVSSLMKFR
ncbi:MAG: hypothetical protein Q9187_007332 [Circinaria calcarea]